MTNFTTETLFSEISKRFAENRPFSTLAAGLQGFQFLGMIEDWFVSLEMNRHKVVSLTATNRRLGTQLPKLMVATRPAPGEYHFTLGKADFDKWIEGLAPSQKQATIWEMFAKVIEGQTVKIVPGGKQILWESGRSSISIVREVKRNYLRLICKNGKLTTSRPVARWGKDHTSRNGDCDGVWILTNEASANYTLFIAEVKS